MLLLLWALRMPIPLDLSLFFFFKCFLIFVFCLVCLSLSKLRSYFVLTWGGRFGKTKLSKMCTFSSRKIQSRDLLITSFFLSPRIPQILDPLTFLPSPSGFRQDLVKYNKTCMTQQKWLPGPFMTDWKPRLCLKTSQIRGTSSRQTPHQILREDRIIPAFCSLEKYLIQ